LNHQDGYGGICRVPGANTKQQLFELIERLPEAELLPAVRLIEILLLDPVRRSMLLAPSDDEPVTEEQDRLIQEALDDLRPTIPHEQILREFGL